MADEWHIMGGRVVDPAAGRDETADLYIAGGRIVASPPGRGAAETIDARGRVVAPGFLDLHVHLRQPGNEAAETIATGSAAAARGGFTAVVAMPNTAPPFDTPRRVRDVLSEGRRVGLTRVLPSACITVGRRGAQLADLAALAEAGAVAFTDDGSTVADDDVMRMALETARGLARPVMDHALEDGVGVMHAGRRAAALGLPGIPSAAETRVVDRDIRLAADTGAAMHIQHVSCRESVERLREARSRGVPVSGELTPHHLALADCDIPGDDARYKMNPPLRSAADREALRAGIVDGTLQALATDHAPHTAEQKRRGFAAAPFGVVGLETAVGVTYTDLVARGALSLADWIARWTVGPAAVLGRPAPSLDCGQPADVVVLDLVSSWIVQPERFASRSSNTPFAGRSLTGRAVMTFCGGRCTWRERASSQ